MGPPICVINRGSNGYILVRPIMTMGKIIKVTTLYEEWLKEVKVCLVPREITMLKHPSRLTESS
jgi:hypothetical protein